MGASCALDDAGAAYCWGTNGFGEVGVGDLDEHLAPTAVAGGHTFTQLGVGFNFVCGLDATGAAWCWGTNALGTIGKGSSADFQVIPAAVSGGHAFTEIAVGGEHACGLTAAGDAWCWGYNIFGELGDGTTTDSNVPVQVIGGLTFSDLGLGSYHS
jgi:alpha-tubulin suppressor-like RCC1 family protein